jgi:hypothetical protein
MRIGHDRRSEAEQVTDRIRAHFEEGYRLVGEVHDRRGWEALGFSSFEELAERSFGRTPQHIGRLLAAAKIAGMIEGPKPMVWEADGPSIPEGTLRPLAALLREGRGEHSRERPDAREGINEAWDISLERSGGRPTAKDVQAAVDEVIERRLTDGGSSPPGEADAFVDRSPSTRAPASRVIQGDARLILPTLPAESMHCCVTSPPYYRLRNYGGGPGEIGRERTPKEYVAILVEIFHEAKRILRPDGTLFLVLGDTYHRGNLLGIPDHVGRALVRDGWYTGGVPSSGRRPGWWTTS